MSKEGTLIKIRRILRQQVFLFIAHDGQVSIARFILLLGLSPWPGVDMNIVINLLDLPCWWLMPRPGQLHS
jgi:hypothetical protein